MIAGGNITWTSSLSLRVFRTTGEIIDYGVVSIRCITDDFVEMLIDVLQSTDSTFSDFKYHDFGTGTTVEDQTDTGLEAPCGDAREIGSQTEGATANIYKSVATHTFGGAYTITEHILANAAVAGITMDRSVFTGIAFGAGDKAEATYELTMSAGG